MTIVVIGAKGMLGMDLMTACDAGGMAVNGFDLPDLDITNPDSLAALPACDWVINCAAYTNVDGAETDPEAAMSVNRDGAGHLAARCKSQGARLIQISTDYVFDGATTSAYTEDAPVNPLGLYGKSKLDGEQAVQASGCNALIVRTQSLFGQHGRHFVSAILARAQETDQIEVVNDQTSCPTYTPHLADAILRLLNCGENGIVHVSAAGACTWYDFAVAICQSAAADVEVIPVTSDQYPRPARRPAYSVLDKTRYQAWTGQVMPEWQEGLEEYLGREHRIVLD